MGRSVANAGSHVMVMTVRRNTFRSCRRTVTFSVFKSVITRRNRRAGEWRRFYSCLHSFARTKIGRLRPKAVVLGLRKRDPPIKTWHERWASWRGGRRTGVLKKLTSSAEYDLTASKGGAFDGVRIKNSSRKPFETIRTRKRQTKTTPPWNFVLSINPSHVIERDIYFQRRTLIERYTVSNNNHNWFPMSDHRS